MGRLLQCFLKNQENGSKKTFTTMGSALLFFYKVKSRFSHPHSPPQSFSYSPSWLSAGRWHPLWIPVKGPQQGIPKYLVPCETSRKTCFRVFCTSGKTRFGDLSHYREYHTKQQAKSPNALSRFLHNYHLIHWFPLATSLVLGLYGFDWALAGCALSAKMLCCVKSLA